MSPSKLTESVLAGLAARPKPLSEAERERELAKCRADALYFIDTYCHIYDNASADWIPFKLWPAQKRTVQAIIDHKLTAVLKTRQVGITWICLCLALWFAIFRPIASILIWSRTDEDAVELLSDKRLRGVFERLPKWMKPATKENNDHDFGFRSGSIMHALPTTRGDGFTATFAFIDEADLDPNLATRLERSKPTIEAGACKLVLNSRADKNNPLSTFKNIYRGAKAGENAYYPVFIAWNEHPDRTPEWYDAECRTSLSTHGSLDEIASNYPTTDVEALAARSLNKRFSGEWLTALTQERKPLPLPPDCPPLPGLKLFAYPEPGHRYGLGVDPAGGLHDGDDSCIQIADAESYEQVAVLAGKIEPTLLADYAADLALWYFNALCLFELNNHGHAFLARARERGMSLKPGIQRDGTSGKAGWITTQRSKGMLYDVGAAVLQEVLTDAAENEVIPSPIIFDFTTSAQLASIDIVLENYLSAPEGLHDDYAMAWVLAMKCIYRGVPSMQRVQHNLHSQPTVNAPPAKMPNQPTLARTFQRRERHLSGNGVPDDVREKLKARGIRFNR